jgi:hypothetical protein
MVTIGLVGRTGAASKWRTSVHYDGRDGFAKVPGCGSHDLATTEKTTATPHDPRCRRREASDGRRKGRHADAAVR